MNLYKIKVQHTAPKDNHVSIACLLLAENDSAVFDWLANDPNLGEGVNSIITCWNDKAKQSKKDYMEEAEIDKDEYAEDLEYHSIKHGTGFKNAIISIKGEMNDEDYDYSDAYYGITLYGWELVKENFTDNYQLLIDANILFTA